MKDMTKNEIANIIHVLAYLAKISASESINISCAILIPDLTRHVEVIEVIADVFLRESLDLKDGSVVHLDLIIG